MPEAPTIPPLSDQQESLLTARRDELRRWLNLLKLGKPGANQVRSELHAMLKPIDVMLATPPEGARQQVSLDFVVRVEKPETGRRMYLNVEGELTVKGQDAFKMPREQAQNAATVLRGQLWPGEVVAVIGRVR